MRLYYFTIFKQYLYHIYKAVEIRALENFADKRSIGHKPACGDIQCRLTEVERSGRIHVFVARGSRGHVAQDNIKAVSDGF